MPCAYNSHTALISAGACLSNSSRAMPSIGLGITKILIKQNLQFLYAPALLERAISQVLQYSWRGEGLDTSRYPSLHQIDAHNERGSRVRFVTTSMSSYATFEFALDVFILC